MRTTWNGSLSFGLVSIPVGLAPATKPAARTSDVSFRMLHRECGTPIKQKRYCPVHERDLGPDEIVKGWEVAKGQFVFVEDTELEALAQHDDSRSIEITRFVDAADVDPIYFDRTYFLVPAQAPLARQVISSLAAEFDPDDLQSDYRRDLRAMLEAKLAGEELKVPEPVEEEAPVVDLMEALRRSVEEAKKGKPAAAKKPAAKPRKRAAAKS